MTGEIHRPRYMICHTRGQSNAVHRIRVGIALRMLSWNGTHTLHRALEKNVHSVVCSFARWLSELPSEQFVQKKKSNLIYRSNYLNPWPPELCVLLLCVIPTRIQQKSCSSPSKGKIFHTVLQTRKTDFLAKSQSKTARQRVHEYAVKEKLLLNPMVQIFFKICPVIIVSMHRHCSFYVTQRWSRVCTGQLLGQRWVLAEQQKHSRARSRRTNRTFLKICPVIIVSPALQLLRYSTLNTGK